MPEGVAFGEIALYERCVRTATIKTMDHSIELAWLSKNHFDEELRAIEETTMDNKVQFLRGVHSWRNLRRKQVVHFVNLCQELNYSYGETVYNEGQPNLFVYIVKSGEFELGKALKRRKSVFNPQGNKKTRRKSVYHS